MKGKVGVVLSGCGHLDGAEIREAVLALLALDRHDLEAVCMAPSGPQRHVVDHLTGQEMAGEVRDVRREAARIARGDVVELAEVSVDDIDALVLPGGFGAAKNLSSFASDGAGATVHPELERLLRAAHAEKKPIGAICIAPAVVARVLGADAHPKLTIGNDPGTAAALADCGTKHVDAPVDGCVVDRDNRIVTTPAYMYDARLAGVADGIEQLVAAVAEMIGGRS